MSETLDPGEDRRLEALVEALLFASDEPLSTRRLAGLLEDATPSRVEGAIEALDTAYLREGRAFRIREIAGGWQIVTRPEFAPWVGRLYASSTVPRLSQAALETLAIVAYKQPVTRAELESIRGVSVDGVLRTLVDRDLVRIVDRAEGIGRPLLYGTSDHFLEYFGLPGIEALPKPEELEVLFADRERERAEDTSGETVDRPAGRESGEGEATEPAG